MNKTNPRPAGEKSATRAPTDLRKALAATPLAAAAWNDLTPIARRDFISWMDSATEPEAHKRRKTIDEAIAEEKKARKDGNADRQDCGYILRAIAATGNLAKMTEICESLAADPVLRCEIYAEAVNDLIGVRGE